MKLQLQKEQRIVTRDLKEKSCCKWAANGDENSKYFHAIVRGRKNKNSLKRLLINGVWTEDPRIIKKEISNYFEEQFK